VGLAAATDICFASEFALIKLSELSIGIGPFVIEPAVKRKIGNAAMAQLTLKAQTFFSAKWACEKGLYANVFETNEALNSEVDILAKELQSYNPEALLAYKKILWQGTEDWDDLLESRATLSGQLVLSPKAQAYLEKYS
jgi:methylglutaconyl-CoA hydratase